MKILLASWMLLLFGVSLNAGHYIRQVKDGDSAVYEVKEDSSGVTFVNPKAKLPTLRDVLFYHVIERAYGKEVLEPIITERSFTNSHGLQFLTADDTPSSNESIELLDEENTESEEQDDNQHDDDDEKNDGDNRDESIENKLSDENDILQEPESTTETKALTDESVKEAFKSRSYLFDQMRQRYSPVKRMVSPDSSSRKKREAGLEAIPDAPQIPSDSSLRDAYVQPKTYGMNLNPEGGYVWNNLNSPPGIYYELGQSPSGNTNEGQNAPPQSQENQPQAPIENYNVQPQVPGNSDSGSSEDIYVDTNKQPSAQPLENQDNPEQNEQQEDVKLPENEPEAVKEQQSEEAAENPIVPIGNENPESYESEQPAEYPHEPVLNENSEAEDGNKQEYNPVVETPESGPANGIFNPDFETPASEKPVIPAESLDLNVNFAPGNEESKEQPLEEPAEESSFEKPEEGSAASSEGDQIKEIPEAPTLSPLNYDNLPDYIRQAISSTEKTGSYEQTDNPYANPQLNPEDKKAVEEKMQDIFATMQPVEDIPKTYGMNLTSDGGHVWNDLVNPPVSYDIGSSNSNQPEEQKESTTEAPASERPEKPESGEVPENPAEELEKAESGEGSTNPGIEPAGPETDPASPGENKDTGKGEVPEITVPEYPEANNELGTKEPENKPDTEAYDSNNESIEGERPVQQPEPVGPLGPIQPVRPEEPAKPEIENIPEPGSEDNGELKPDDGEASGEQEQDKESEPNEAILEEDNKEKPDIMNELLKSEQFWKWLGQWTATYMELLEKHIRKIAIQEICNRERQGSQMCLLDAEPEEESLIKDGKVVNGNEIATADTNIIDKLRRGNKDDYRNKVDATTIYGNTIGNEKVTNVFIFNSDKANEILEELKPGNNTKVNFVIDERNKEEIKDPHGITDDIEAVIDEVPKEDVKEIDEPNKPVSSESESAQEKELLETVEE